MQADLEQFYLAFVTGIAFGAIEFVFWRATATRVAMVLVALYILQTFAQLVWRYFDGMSSTGELLTITAIRLTFLVAAVATSALLHAWEDR